MAQPLFLEQMRGWAAELRKIASARPGTGACTLATAFKLWLWTYDHLASARDANGEKLYAGPRQGVTFRLADALCWLLASRAQIMDLLELAKRGPENVVLADGLPGLLEFLGDLCHVQAAAAAGEVGRICAELTYGYNRHPAWDAESRKVCYGAEDLEALEGIISGMAGCAVDVIGEAGAHPDKEGPCASCQGLHDFAALRMKLDGCLTGTQLAKDRAAAALSKVMIPEALDYPA